MKRGTICDETPIIPEIIADMVCDEAGGLISFLNPKYPPAVRLCERAERHFQGAGGPSFARNIRGSKGREYLASFMRHWLAAMLIEAGCPRAQVEQTPLL